MGLPYGPLVVGRRGQTESGDYAFRVYHQSRLEAVDPLGLGGAPPEGSLPREESLARSPYPHDGRDEGRVHNAKKTAEGQASSWAKARCKRRNSGSRARMRLP
jgi:hypothetical protein